MFRISGSLAVLIAMSGSWSRWLLMPSKFFPFRPSATAGFPPEFQAVRSGASAPLAFRQRDWRALQFLGWFFWVNCSTSRFCLANLFFYCNILQNSIFQGKKAGDRCQAPMTSLLFNPVNDSLLASSETARSSKFTLHLQKVAWHMVFVKITEALFVWSLESEVQAGRTVWLTLALHNSEARLPLSPLRSVQESETPDSRKPKMPVRVPGVPWVSGGAKKYLSWTEAFTPPPRPRTGQVPWAVSWCEWPFWSWEFFKTEASTADGLFNGKRGEPAQAPRTPLKVWISAFSMAGPRPCWSLQDDLSQGEHQAAWLQSDSLGVQSVKAEHP